MLYSYDRTTKRPPDGLFNQIRNRYQYVNVEMNEQISFPCIDHCGSGNNSTSSEHRQFRTVWMKTSHISGHQLKTLVEEYTHIKEIRIPVRLAPRVLLA